LNQRVRHAPGHDEWAGGGVGSPEERLSRAAGLGRSAVRERAEGQGPRERGASGGEAHPDLHQALEQRAWQ